jgi:hypothetical protein
MVECFDNRLFNLKFPNKPIGRIVELEILELSFNKKSCRD